MRVIQVMPTIAIGDAVSNDARALKKVIDDMGISNTQIFAENIDPRLSSGTAEYFHKIGELSDKDIIIYHESVGTDLNNVVKNLKCNIIMRYHNITPPDFFYEYNEGAAQLSKIGLLQTKALSKKVKCVLADSDFNKRDLYDMGYRCPMEIMPILIPFEDYDRMPDYNLVEQYNDNYINILFVGRIVPNKKQEDIIKVFDYYKRHINSKSRLFLVGNYEGMESYKERLDKYIAKLELDDVIFLGHIKFEEILSLYKLADVFLCMSEHEGFCVPLVEAMKFEIPIIAYDSCAVASTLGNAGILVDNKDPREISLWIERILTDTALRKKMKLEQKKMLEKYSYECIREQFERFLCDYIVREREGK